MTDTKPVIGIIACNRTVGIENAHAVMARYVTATTTYASCLALLVPPIGEAAADLAPRLDGLLLTGSPSNLAPHLYGETGGEGPFDAGRDQTSLTMIKAMIARGKPVFGICRGFQELNVALGGTLRRDVGHALTFPHHALDDTPFDALFDYLHAVDLTSNGVLRSTFSCDHIMVNSVHYQGIGRLGEGLSVEAVAEDGLIEAFSGEVNGAKILGVQWHPEWQTESHPQSQVFFQLLGRALRRRALI